MNPFHWAFDKIYPAIRFYHEKVSDNLWYTQITPEGACHTLSLGGAPTYRRDYQFLVDHGIDAIVDIRDDARAIWRFTHTRHRADQAQSPDMTVPQPDILDQGVRWMEGRRRRPRVLVHCAKGPAARRR